MSMLHGLQKPRPSLGLREVYLNPFCYNYIHIIMTPQQTPALLTWHVVTVYESQPRSNAIWMELCRYRCHEHPII